MTGSQLTLLILIIISVVVDLLYLRWKQTIHQQEKSVIGIAQHITFIFCSAGIAAYQKVITNTKTSIAPLKNRRWSSAEIFFRMAIINYLICISVGLERFPIYFFTDEAVHVNLAADFIHSGLKNYQNEFLPAYFSLGSMFGLNGVSVYLQVIPYLLFGKSVFVTRFVSGIITLIGAIFVSLTLRDIFSIRQYWLGLLLLIISPAWFLHARTAFEYMELSGFYAGFIYFYLLYRTGKPRALYAAVVLGALAFYTHGLGQILMGTTVLILLVLDFRFHFDKDNRGIFLRAFILALALSLPFIRFYLAHSRIIADELRQRGSYWTIASLSLLDKLGLFVKEYFHGLDPRYWYIPNDRDLIRHVMKGYGNLLWPMFPFAVIGLGKLMLNIKSPQSRTILVALLVSPMPAALVAIGITRVLWFIIPISLITTIGISDSLDWLEQRFKLNHAAAESIVFIALAAFSIYMLADALTHGPTWYEDYTLYGMQFGGKQIFRDTILPALKSDSNARYVISPNWANGADQLFYFYIPAEYRQRVRLGTVDDYLIKKIDFSPATLFVMIPGEYKRAVDNPIFRKVQVEQIINYPNGAPGFYIAHITYADNADGLIAVQREVLSQAIQGEVRIDDQPAKILYSRNDMGTLADLFDGDYSTLLRGAAANPFMLDITFQTQRPISRFVGDLAIMDYTIIFVLYPVQGRSERYEITQTGVTTDAHVELNFDRGPALVKRIVINILDLSVTGDTNIHIRELKFVP